MKIKVTKKFSRTIPVGQSIPFTLLTMLVFGYFFTTPQFASPDEPAQMATAWVYTSPDTNLGFSSPTLDDKVPEILFFDPSCYKFNSTQDASCLPKLSDMSTKFETPPLVTNYPPLYYWVVGSGLRIGELIGSTWMLNLGRLFSLFLNLGLLFWVFRGRNRIATFDNWALLIGLTPMYLFLIPTINPSSWEVTTAIAFVYFFSKIFLRSPRSAQNYVILGFLAILLTLSRPLGMVWLVLLSFFCLFFPFGQRNFAPWDPKTIISLLPSLILGVLWYFKAGGVAGNIDPEYPYSISEWVTHGWKSLELIPERIRQGYGVLGWLDTPPPAAYYFIVCTLLTVFMYNNLRNQKKLLQFFVAYALTAILVFTAIELYMWKYWPLIWQGRYSLALLLGIWVLFFTEPKTDSILENLIFTRILLLLSPVMLIINFFRYSYGLSPVSILSALFDPALSDWRILGFLVCLSGYFLLLYRSRIFRD